MLLYNFITRLHKKIIENLLSETATLNDSLKRELLYYANLYQLFIYCQSIDFIAYEA